MLKQIICYFEQTVCRTRFL